MEKKNRDIMLNNNNLNIEELLFIQIFSWLINKMTQ